jgi:hypothetical protein
MRKLILTSFVCLLFIQAINAQSNYKTSVSLSPFSFIGGRINTKVERLTGKNLTYGGRLEATFVESDLDKHLWINPFGRLYFFSKEATGLYLEGGAFYRMRYAKSANWTATEDYYKSAPGVRMATGFQWFAGSSKKIPIDVMFGLNVDFGNKNLPSEGIGADVNRAANALVGPLNVFLFRLQTGISF